MSSRSICSFLVTAVKQASTLPAYYKDSCMHCSIGAIISISLEMKNLKSLVEIAWWFFVDSCSACSFSLFSFALMMISIKCSNLARLLLLSRITFLRQEINMSLTFLFILGITKSLKSQSGKPCSAILVRYWATKSIIDSSNCTRPNKSL